MSFHKTGKFFQAGEEVSFTKMVKSVLNRTLGDRPASIKKVANWIGAGERTVKNWFAGAYAPRGQHFSALVRHCPEMLEAFLNFSGRQDRLAFIHIEEARRCLRQALDVLDLLAERSSD